jgi:hypothetical protein
LPEALLGELVEQRRVDRSGCDSVHRDLASGELERQGTGEPGHVDFVEVAHVLGRDLGEGDLGVQSGAVDEHIDGLKAPERRGDRFRVGDVAGDRDRDAARRRLPAAMRKRVRCRCRRR